MDAPRENKKETIAPTPKDYKTIAVNVPVVERAIIAALALRGLRTGALPTLELKAGRYHGKSKGKILTEGQAKGITLPAAVIEAVKAAKLDLKKPFAWINANARTPDQLPHRQTVQGGENRRSLFLP
jgi:hypothetical protein